MKNPWRLIRGHQQPVRFVLARLLMLTGTCRFLTIQQAGYRLRFHPSNISSQLWIDPHQRSADLQFLNDYLKPGDVMVDVGANIGETVLTAAIRVGSRGRVLGIEPHPRTFRFLQDNVRLNGVANVDLVNRAVGAVSGVVQFSDDRRDDMNRVGGGDIQVPVERLDSLVPADAAIALLKVDVEGYERFVFEGAPQVLTRTACVFFEVSGPHFAAFGYRTQDVLAILLASGFRLFRVAGPRALRAVGCDFDTAALENLVALRDLDEARRRTGWTVES